jgi:hypothetical protein
MSVDYDDMTPAERAEVDVERLVEDFAGVLGRLIELRNSTIARPYFGEAEENTLYSCMTSLQLLCSTFEEGRKAYQRDTSFRKHLPDNFIPAFLSRRGDNHAS